MFVTLTAPSFGPVHTTRGTGSGRALPYGHLMPDSENRTRQAVDSAWSCAPDVPSEAETGR